MTQKPEALRMADALEAMANNEDMGRKPNPKCKKRKAAAELRRQHEEIEALAKLVRADAIAEEREACANLRKKIWLVGIPNTDYEDGFWDALAKYEDMIRARGNT